jgi:hypothetical protein
MLLLLRMLTVNSRDGWRTAGGGRVVRTLRCGGGVLETNIGA